MRVGYFKYTIHGLYIWIHALVHFVNGQRAVNTLVLASLHIISPLHVSIQFRFFRHIYSTYFIICDPSYEKVHPSVFFKYLWCHIKFNLNYCIITLINFELTALVRVLGHTQTHRPTSYFFFRNMPQCTLCQKLYTSEFGVLRHKRAIHERRPYGHCAAGGKSFIRSLRLSQHMKSHAGFFKFSCDDCDRGFQEAGALVTHKTLTHQAAKGQCCGVCNKEFSYASSASRHRKIHREEISAHKKDFFKCSTCGKTFKTKKYLT